MSDEQWRNPLFRENIIKKINEIIRINNLNDKKLNAIDMELKCYQKAKSKSEYMTFIAKLIIYLKSERIFFFIY